MLMRHDSTHGPPDPRVGGDALTVLNDDFSVCITSTSEAAGHGDMRALRALVAEDPASVHRPDKSGFFPLQWASLNGHTDEVKYLLAHGALVNAADSTGNTALHWAVVHGRLACIDILMSMGADWQLKDNSGYTAVHVAAQHGQTAALYLMVMKWKVDVDQPDNEGRTPLHWAAYKGHIHVMRLLLVLDARCDAADSGGCTPLHWAAIKGQSDACTILLQAGALSVLDVKDASGLSPLQLASEKDHRYLALYLSEYKSRKAATGCFGKNGPLHWLVRSQLCPLIWVYIVALLLVFTQKVMVCPKPLSGPLLALGWSVVVAAAPGLGFLFKTTMSDPGFIPTASHGRIVDEEQQQMLPSPARALDSPALWDGNWHQLCVSCRIVRPLRAKHCCVTERCVEVYDHYCPWVGNVIGKGNLRPFLIFLWLELYAAVCSSLVGAVQLFKLLSQEEEQWVSFPLESVVWLAGFTLVDVMVGAAVAVLAVSQTLQVARNITTNERLCWHRYSYLQTETGAFYNPYDKGWRHNCAQVCAPGGTPATPAQLLPRASVMETVSIDPEPQRLSRGETGALSPATSMFIRKGYSREVGLSELESRRSSHGAA